jgi:hypothetical protein
MQKKITIRMNAGDRENSVHRKRLFFAAISVGETAGISHENSAIAALFVHDRRELGAPATALVREWVHSHDD